MTGTVRELIDAVSADLGRAGLVFGHGYDSAWDEAVALVLHVTGLEDDTRVLDQPVSEPHQRRIEDLVRQRRERRLPLAHLLGRCRYAGLEFLIEPGIVVPRSPIGQLLAEDLRPWLSRPPVRVLDLCTGSGCIGIVAAHRWPEAAVELVDVDPRAVDLAQRNVAMHGLTGRVRVHRSDLFDGLPEGRWDLILSNPPYVDALDMASLPAEYRHEPEWGLAGGADGLAVVVRILEALPQRLTAHGLLVCEVGASVPALLRRYPRTPFLWPDLPDAGDGVFLLPAADAP